MKIPDSIRINGVDYKIIYTPALNDGQNVLYGRINYENSVIELNPERQAHQHMCVTLWHEILHGIADAMELSEKMGDNEELIVNTFARGVYQVLQDNMKLFDMDTNPVLVRCGECERYNTMNCPMRKDEARFPVRDDGFCYYGERKKDGTAYGTYLVRNRIKMSERRNYL